MQPWFDMLGAQKNRLIEKVCFSTHMFWLQTFKVYIPVSYTVFLSMVTVLINSRERQHNYQKKLPGN